MRDIAGRYRQYYDRFYAAASGEFSEGQTTEYEADQRAQAAAHMMTQRLMCQTDLYYLSTAIFQMDSARKDGRKIWYAPIHSQLCDELQAPRSSLIQLSRNMLKSTVAAIWVVQQLLADPQNVAIGMWSRSSARVRSSLHSIKGMLKNPKLLELFPDRLIPDDKKWERRNQDSLTVTRKVADEDGNIRQIPIQEEQVEVWGLESTVTGRHYTHHFFDDIIDRDNTNTANAIEKARAQWEAIQMMRSPETIEKMIGTPWHQLDLYSVAAEEGFFDKILKIPGVHEDGTIVYPFFTRQFLDQQLSRLHGNEYLFSCQYYLNTMPRSHRMFALPVPHWSPEMFPKRPKYYIAADPSTGRSERHDSTGIAVGAVDASAPKEVFFVEAEGYQWKPEQFAEELVKRIVQYCPERVGIEYGQQYGLEALIEYKMREARAAGKRFPNPVFVEISTGGGKGLDKAEKINRALGAMVRERRAYFTSEMRHLFAQMGSFNPNVDKNDDDILDACSMLIQTVPYFHQAHWFGVEERAVGPQGFDFFKRKVRQAKQDRIFAA